MIVLSAGGDRRMTLLTALFLPSAKRVYQLAPDPDTPPPDGVKQLDYLFWVQEQPDLLLLPLPFSRDGVRLTQNAKREEIKLRHLLDLCHKDTVVCGGNLTDAFLTDCHSRGLTVFDYTTDPMFYRENCRLTALGTEKLLQQNGIAFENRLILLTGFGGCSKALLELLLQKGADVTVAARKASAREAAASLGAKTTDFPLPLSLAPSVEMVINTVPATVVGEEFLRALPQNAVYLELASLPGSEAAKISDPQFIYLNAPGLPGRFFPEEAANAIYKAICHFLQKKED